jgi:acyl transferase domain-containing protein/NADPH:quinone reductase-like Zn-dependent oxidoreductase/NAD(P)-dependent dehydrogenase (short-subunit alcohol dehydrogenase family)
MHTNPVPPQPIAVIGIGCRFPGGADSPEHLWELLTSGRDGVTDIPEERWSVKRFYSEDPAAPAKMYVRRAALLRERIDEFDPLFFGISPREACYMDPQQRLLLEVAWEAIEDAGLDADRLAGSPTGVYIGGFTLDAMVLYLNPLNRGLVNTHHTTTAASMTMLANRISYAFDLRGPSLAIDTACSASLVAIHYACQGLWNGECPVALAGGVNVILCPEFMSVMCKGHFLAPDGRCKSFDARADGYGRGEGCGVVVLKPLAAAERDGDAIYAVVCGTGLNQDGRTIAIPVPSAEAQEALIRQVYERAGVSLESVRYVEAHGTGTPVGDPIEAEALGKTFGRGRRPSEACVIGSVKANIGHLEAAAGVAGLVKACLCVHHRAIPPQVHAETPNPEIPFVDLGLRLPTGVETMSAGTGPIVVGVNSFGYGGTNAHAVLREAPLIAPRREGRPPSTARPCLFPLSARSEKALAALAQRYVHWLSCADSPSIADVCYSAATRRTHFEHRLAVLARSTAELAAQLETFVGAGHSDQVLTGKSAASQRTAPVFVLTGMGPQWWAMGRQILADEPVCRAIVTECDERFRSLAGWSIVEAMNADEATSQMSEPRIAQPANFVLQVALAALWRSWGIEPAAVVGHSAGEVAAAYIAGALDLSDAIAVIYHRSRLQQATAGAGRMLAAELSRDAVQALLDGRNAQLSIAAVNGPSSTTVSGDPAHVAALAADLDTRGVFNRVLQVDVAYHSYQMEPLEAPLLGSLESLNPRVPAIPLYSTVTGERVEDVSYDAAYWYRNIRWPVLFSAAVDRLIAREHAAFLEIGPHPVLAAAIKECLTRRGAHGEVLASLRRDEVDHQSLARTLAALYTNGFSPAWDSLYPSDARYVRLPTYPFQRERYWVETQAGRADRLGNVVHPLLGSPLPVAGAAWESDLNPNYTPFLSDHVVDGVTVYPAAAYVEAGLAMQALVNGRENTVLEELTFPRALLVDSSERVRLQWRYDDQTREFQAHSSSENIGGDWSLHASGRISTAAPATPTRLDLVDLQTRCNVAVDPEELYGRLRSHGLQYGAAFRGVRAAWRHDREVLALLHHAGTDEEDAEYRLHPALLDAAFHVLIATLDPGDAAAAAVFVPVAIDRVRFFSRPTKPCWCHGRIARASAIGVEADVVLFDAGGTIAADVRGLRLAALSTPTDEAERQLARWTYALEWQKAETVPAFADPARWLLFTNGDDCAAAIRDHLEEQGGAEIVEVVRGESFERDSPRRFEIRPEHRDDMTALADEAAMSECRGVVYMWGLDTTRDGADSTGMRATIDALHLLQTLGPTARPDGPRLYVITRGAQQVDRDEPLSGLAQAPLVGLARVASCEYSDLRCTTIDTDPNGVEAGRWAALEILADTREDDVALRGSDRYVRRLVRASTTELEEAAAARRLLHGVDGHSFMLEVGTPGVLDSLRYREIVRRAPAAGEIEVEIRAAALNFKDVLKALGVLPAAVLEGTFHRERLGMEAAGVIARVGEGVTEYKAGEAIVASLPSSFSSHVTVPAAGLLGVSRLEAGNPIEAAGIPVAFVTAYYALHEVARLGPDERVLVHAATGGVGLAAIQVARWLGAEIYATAGSPEKREYLRRLGVQHVWDSRTLEFADGIRAATGGQGVDVVLNSLSGEAFLKSLAVAAPFGRFIEIGKRDIVENTRMPLLPFNRNLTFTAVDLDRLMLERPGLIRRMFDQIQERLRAGDFVPVPISVFPAAQVSDAFRHMAQAKHIGKVVLDFTNVQDVTIAPAAERDRLFSADASYLVTGGFGGVGLEVARWLAGQGVRYLVLAGRHGAATPDARAVVDALRADGVSVMAAEADISREEHVVRLLAEAAQTMPPLRGVFHAAGILDDGLIGDLTAERMTTVMAPKARGAWLLHEHTRALTLEYFVLFSSATAWIGNPGQANYVAANVYLDALARHRRASGLPATSIAWGAFGGTGMVAANPQAAEYLSRVGIRPIPAAAGVASLSRILRWDPPDIAVLDVDWGKLRQAHPIANVCPRFMHVIAESEGGAVAAMRDLREALQTVPPEERLDWTIQGIITLVAEALRIAPEAIDIHRPLTQLGIDSLIGMELQAAVRTRLGIDVSILQWMKGGTIAGVAVQVLQRFNIPYTSRPEDAGLADYSAPPALAGGVAAAGGRMQGR